MTKCKSCDEHAINVRYEQDVNELKDAIKELIPEHPHILTMTSPWPLLKIEAFKPIQRTLAPSLAQASAAWRQACIEFEMEERGQLKVNGKYIMKSRLKYDPYLPDSNVRSLLSDSVRSDRWMKPQ